MFGLFKRKPDLADDMGSVWNKETDRLEAIYAEAKHIEGCNPSVDGNKVIFDAPELESKIEQKGDGITLVMHTGSVKLDMHSSRKVFKNNQGQVHRIEVFNTMRCRMYCQ